MSLFRKTKLTVYFLILIGASVYWYSVHFPSTNDEVSVVLEKKKKKRKWKRNRYTSTPAPQLKTALSFCKRKGYSTQFILMLDFSVHSGNFRLFGINPSTGDTLIRSLVSHGHCHATENRFAEFSNEPGSNCSSLGRYKVSGKYTGSFGLSYRLRGLDRSNSNAINRYVVLHAHECVPLEEQEDDICLSQGCPMVAPSVLDELASYLDYTRKPILLWIYD